MKNVLVLFVLLFLVGCSTYQVQDKYFDYKAERHYFEKGCYNMQVNLESEQAYVSECFERSLPQSYIAGFTLGIVDFSAADYKFENALLNYLNDKYKLNNCKIYRTNLVELMGDTQGVEVFFECDNKKNSDIQKS
tara:strand:+ start:325 stop:729 length:405 start_codon:yes stop_codon:yes gene_type:complete